MVLQITWKANFKFPSYVGYTQRDYHIEIVASFQCKVPRSGAKCTKSLRFYMLISRSSFCSTFVLKRKREKKIG